MSNTPTSSAQVAEGMNLEAERAAPYQFRKKPVVIEAFQFHRRNNGPVPYPDWYDDAMTRNDIITHNTGKWHDPTQPAYCEIKTLEGVMRANEGDWIIRGIKGEIYPCRADIFAVTYEATTPVAEGVALPPLPPIDEHWMTNDHTYTAEQVRQAQREAIAPYAERIRQLEREHGLLSMVVEQLKGRLISADALIESMATKADRRAYIDGRTAGPAVPEGYAIVPEVPTKEMIVAIERKVDEQLVASGMWAQDMQRQDGADIYEAAIAAAPKPQEKAP